MIEPLTTTRRGSLTKLKGCHILDLIQNGYKLGKKDFYQPKVVRKRIYKESKTDLCSSHPLISMLRFPWSDFMLFFIFQLLPHVPRVSFVAPVAAASPPTGTVMEGLTVPTALMNPSPAVSVAQLSHPQNRPVGFVCLLPPHYQLLGYCVFVSVRQSASVCWSERPL